MNEQLTIYQVLELTGLPCAYSHFKGNQTIDPPYIVYIGNGQTVFEADNNYYFTQNNYQIEYYFKEKNSYLEAEIERILLDNGYRYDKSEDIYLEDEDVFLIYYYV